jgi:hypothetical protein
MKSKTLTELKANPPVMSQASNFAFDFQEVSGLGKLKNSSHVEIIMAALEKNIEVIDKPASKDNTIVFLDKSIATWNGRGWNLDETKWELKLS